MWDFADCPKDLCLKVLRKVMTEIGRDKDTKYIVHHCEEDNNAVKASMTGKILFKNDQDQLRLTEFWLELYRDESNTICFQCGFVTRTPASANSNTSLCINLNEKFEDMQFNRTQYDYFKRDLELYSEAFED